MSADSLSLTNPARYHITSHQALKQEKATSNSFFYTFMRVREKKCKKKCTRKWGVYEWGEYKQIYEVCCYMRLHYIEIQALCYLETHMHRIK